MAVMGFFAILSIAPLAWAAEATTLESITLSPVAKRYELKAGDTKTDELTVVNDGREAYDFIAYAKPYSVSNENYNPDFNTEATNSDAYRWVKFDKPKYRLDAGASTTVRYTLTVPADAAPGGHYGVLFVETQPKPIVGEGNAVARKKRVGAILYATVDGTYRTGGKQESFNLPFLQLSPPLTATLKTSNDGNTDFIDSVTFRVSDLFGSLKYEEKKDFPILPQTARKMTLEWKEATTFGLYKVDVSSKFLDQRHDTSGFVLIVPAWALGVLVVLLVGGVAYLIVRRFY
jgi:hypothetical protein